MPIVKRPNFMDIEIPFDKDTIVKLQREGYEVLPDSVASDKRKGWKDKQMHTPQTLKLFRKESPRAPAIPDNLTASEQILSLGHYTPYPNSLQSGGISQVIPNQMIYLHNNQVFDPNGLTNRQLQPQLYNRDLRVQATPVPNIKLSEVPAPKPVTLNDLAATMLVNRTNPLST